MQVTFAGERLEVSGDRGGREKERGRRNEADEDGAAKRARKVVKVDIMVGSLFSRAKG